MSKIGKKTISLPKDSSIKIEGGWSDQIPIEQIMSFAFGIGNPLICRKVNFLFFLRNGKYQIKTVFLQHNICYDELRSL